MQFVSEILSGKRSITPETAIGLASAFGTSPQLWLNMEAAYRLSKISLHRDSAVERRALIYRSVPVKEIVDRRWIEDSKDVAVLEDRILKFYGKDSLDELSKATELTSAFRHSTSYADPPTPAQLAWYCRAKQLAQKLPVSGSFPHQSFETILASLAKLKAEFEQLRQVPEILSKAGIRFLIVQHLAHTKIDGVCFWLDDESPVVVLSLRYDRVDWFWHTIMHEMCHVKNRDGLGTPEPRLDTELVGTDAEPIDNKPESEKRADQCATDFLVSQRALDDFIRGVRPYYSALEITHFAERIGVHPGIVVGQLQHRREIPFSHSRRMLVGVKEIVTAATLTDGWGRLPNL